MKTKPSKLTQGTKEGNHKHLSEDDWKKIELFMKAGASQERIAIALDICRETLAKKCKERYGEEYTDTTRRFNTNGKLLIEATQYQKALSGNTTMLMWLGKVLCGQREPDTVSTIPANQSFIDDKHENMQLKHELAMLKEKYGHQPETGQEFRGGDPSF